MARGLIRFSFIHTHEQTHKVGSFRLELEHWEPHMREPNVLHFQLFSIKKNLTLNLSLDLDLLINLTSRVQIFLSKNMNSLVSL